MSVTVATQTVPEVGKDINLPPTPPETIVGDEDGKSVDVVKDVSEVPLPPPTTIPTEVLNIDKKTPDAHVPRDPRLIRLTGVHPFNVEAPLTDLFNEGFLTSPELFYVRNHGAVPVVKEEEIPDWEFSVEGCVPDAG
jgi:nitrate reductase (NAD(P)H)